jgi:hypothetical protein
MRCERIKIFTLICKYIPHLLIVLTYIVKWLDLYLKGPKFSKCRIISLFEEYFLLLNTFYISRYIDISLISCYFWHFSWLFLYFSFCQKSVTRVATRGPPGYSVAEWYPYLPLHPTNNTLYSWTPTNIMGCICKKISWHLELSQLIHYYL